MSEKIRPKGLAQINAETNQVLQQLKEIRMEQLKQTIESVKIALANAEELKKKAFDLILMQLLQRPDMVHLNYIGYTPGFNDGDPCYHHGVLSYNGYNEYREDYFMEYLSEEEVEKYLEKVKSSYGNSNYEYLRLKKLSEESQYLFDSLCELGFEEYLIDKSEEGTDFSCLVTLEDGEIKYHFDDYDCGY